MGTFDTVSTPYGRFQTKAFGKGMSTYEVGDEVLLRPSPRSWEDEEAIMRGTFYNRTPVPPAYQVRVLSEREGDKRDHFITVRRNRIVEVGLRKDKKLPQFDYYGQPVS